MEIETKKYPTFLKIVVIIGFVVLGLKLLDTGTGMLSGGIPQSEIEETKNTFKQLFKGFPNDSKIVLKQMLDLIEVYETNYVQTKVIPFFALLVAFIGNLLIRRRKMIGLHLIIAGSLGAFITVLLVLYKEPLGIVFTISNYLLIFVYAILAFINRKHLT